MKKRIAHFVSDQTFVSSAYRAFEKVRPGGNVFYIPVNSKSLRHVSHVPVESVSRLACFSPKFLKKLEGFDLVVLHSLTKFNLDLVMMSGGGVNYLWIGMGYDYYDLMVDNEEELLKPITRRELRNCTSNERFTVRGVRERVESEVKNLLTWRHNKRRLVNKISYFAPVLEEEYTRINARYPGMLGKYVEWSYALSANLVDGKSSVQNVRGDNILVGNSGAVTNNHLDVFYVIEGSRTWRGRKIVCPLSYGDDEYIKVVVRHGKHLFGQSFVPIYEFKRYDDYARMLSECSHVIMNQRRQQAGGNIIMALFMGASVFLEPANLFYEHFIAKGVKVMNIRDLETDPEWLSHKLTEDEVERNKYLLRRTRGWCSVYARTKRLIEECMNSRRIG